MRDVEIPNGNNVPTVEWCKFSRRSVSGTVHFGNPISFLLSWSEMVCLKYREQAPSVRYPSLLELALRGDPVRFVGGEASHAFPVCKYFAFPFISLGGAFCRPLPLGILVHVFCLLAYQAGTWGKWNTWNPSGATSLWHHPDGVGGGLILWPDWGTTISATGHLPHFIQTEIQFGFEYRHTVVDSSTSVFVLTQSLFF